MLVLLKDILFLCHTHTPARGKKKKGGDSKPSKKGISGERIFP